MSEYLVEQLGKATGLLDEERQITKALKEVIFDLLDGQTAWYEIKEHTGLSEARCKEIEALQEIIAGERAALEYGRKRVSQKA